MTKIDLFAILILQGLEAILLIYNLTSGEKKKWTHNEYKLIDVRLFLSVT